MRWPLLLALAACGDNHLGSIDAGDFDPQRCEKTRGTNIVMRQVAGFQGGLPVLLTSPPNDPRQFVVLLDGRIMLLDHGSVLPDPFLDVTETVATGSERGLLGLAFHPGYATNGTFYIFYTTLSQNLVARYQRRDDTHADPTGTIVLAIDDFAFNHNGGMIEFGSDNFLYIGSGDGGGAGDPMRTSGDPHQLLGKLLRIDVDNRLPGKEYGIPATNPFADGVAGAPEVYAMGLRNPWRWSFDRQTDDLWIGDVGQDLWEEVDYVPAGSIAGADLGWSRFEAASCFRPPCPVPDATIPPVVVHSHAPDGWCSVIGGQVYRGSCYPDLVGTYFFTDYCKHTLESARVINGHVQHAQRTTRSIELDGRAYPDSPLTPTSLHADASGELYLTTTTCCGSSFIGGLYHLEAER